MPVANSCRYWKDIVVNMENNTQKLDVALEFALQVPESGENGSSQAGYNAEEDRWRVIVKYYGDINSIIAGITGAEATSLFNNYAVVNLPASQLVALSEAQGIIYIEKPREMYYNVNNGREASCISAVQADVTGRFLRIGFPLGIERQVASACTCDLCDRFGHCRVGVPA